MNLLVLPKKLVLAIFVTIICFELSSALSCYHCVTTITSTNTWGAYSKAFNLPTDSNSTTSNCISSPSSVPVDTNCTNSCLTVISNNTESSFALRGCSDTMITSSQWSALSSSLTSSSVEAKCFVSTTPSTSTSIPASSKLCFCKTDKCNSQLYADISSSSLPKFPTISIILFCVLSIVINCLII